MGDPCETQKGDLQEQITNIRDNHLMHLAKDVTDIKVAMATHAQDLNWLKRFFWIVATTSVGSLLTGLMNLVISQ